MAGKYINTEKLFTSSIRYTLEFNILKLLIRFLRFQLTIEVLSRFALVGTKNIDRYIKRITIQKTVDPFNELYSTNARTILNLKLLMMLLRKY